MMRATPTQQEGHEWARYLTYMEAGGELALEPRALRTDSLRAGIVVCAGLVAGAMLLEHVASRLLAGSTLDSAMFAMLLGLGLGNAGFDVGALRPGSRWVVRVVLPLGIVLLGARLNLADLVGLGMRGLMLSVGVLCLSAATLYTMARWRGIPGRLATLLAVGNGICGGSAVIAVAPAIGATEDDVAVSIATLALLGLVGMLALPLLGTAFGMDPVSFGTWCGLVIQQTPQVIAAGFAHGAESGEVATVIKLVRISLLAPVVVLVGLTFRLRIGRREPSQPAVLTLRGLVPSFAIGLLLLAAIASVGFFPQVVISFGSESALGAVGTTLNTQALAVGASKLCLVAGMAAVGLETRWQTLRRTGPAALLAAACGSAVVIAAAGVAVTLL